MDAKESLAGYAVLSRYYSAMVAGRSHSENQYELVLKPALEQLSPASRVLDAACGSGAELAEVADRHDKLQVIGADGCSEMLQIAIKDPRLRAIPLSCCSWSELDALFQRTGLADYVFILGNAIAHVPNTDYLRSVLAKIREGLRPGGYLTLDTREWAVHESDGSLVEKDRSVGVARDLGTFDVTGENVRIADCCEYRGGRQVIRYVATHEDSGATTSCEVSYLPFQAKQLRDWLVADGFSECQTLDLQPNYPYLVTHARVK